MARVRLAKEVKVKDRQIEDLTQQQVIVAVLWLTWFSISQISQRRDLKLRQT